MIPLAPRESTLAKGRVLLTGDAAGLADPVTAEGITSAIQSGQMAADAIARDFNDPVSVERAYNEALGESILAEHRIARRLAGCLYNFPRIRTAAFAWRGQRLVQEADALLDAEHRPLVVRIADHADDDAVEDRRGARDDVEVAEGDRVIGPRADDGSVALAHSLSPA